MLLFSCCEIAHIFVPPKTYFRNSIVAFSRRVGKFWWWGNNVFSMSITSSSYLEGLGETNVCVIETQYISLHDYS